MKKLRNKGLGFILVLLFFTAATLFAIYGIITYDANGRETGRINSISEIRFGIDIRGGVEAYFEAAKGTDASLLTNENLDAARAILEIRMDNKNITDREISVDYINKRVLIRFPWKSTETTFDASTAISELGQTGLLTFRDPDGKVVIEGSEIKTTYSENIYETSSSTTLQPVVQIELTADGATKFAAATASLIGSSISIYMDETLIESPTVKAEITGGKCYITCTTIADAKELSDIINAGALPFKLVSTGSNIISASLGQSALQTMIMAGIIAFALVSMMMLLVYRMPGIIAIISLYGQMLAQLLVLAISQYTLTLPGIAGIILSIGIGVDANVIISERIKEEINLGKTIRSSIDAGYKKAFTAIFDGNITITISAALLLILGSGTMKSFGFTLLVGVIFNLLIGVVLSRAVSKSIGALPFNKNKWLYGYKKPKDAKKEVSENV